MLCPYKPGDMLKIRANRRTVHYVKSWAEAGGDMDNPVMLQKVQESELLIFRGCYSRGVFECDVELAEGPW